MSFYKFSVCIGHQSVLYLVFSLMLYIKKRYLIMRSVLPPQSIAAWKHIPELSWRMKKFHTFGFMSLRIWLELKCKYLHNEQIENNIKMTALLRSILLSKFLNNMAKKFKLSKKNKSKSLFAKPNTQKMSTSSMFSFQRRTLNI